MGFLISLRSCQKRLKLSSTTFKQGFVDWKPAAKYNRMWNKAAAFPQTRQFGWFKSRFAAFHMKLAIICTDYRRNCINFISRGVITTGKLADRSLPFLFASLVWFVFFVLFRCFFKWTNINRETQQRHAVKKIGSSWRAEWRNSRADHGGEVWPVLLASPAVAAPWLGTCLVEARGEGFTPDLLSSLLKTIHN